MHFSWELIVAAAGMHFPRAVSAASSLNFELGFEQQCPGGFTAFVTESLLWK